MGEAGGGVPLVPAAEWLCVWVPAVARATLPTSAPHLQGLRGWEGSVFSLPSSSSSSSGLSSNSVSTAIGTNLAYGDSVRLQPQHSGRLRRRCPGGRGA